MLPASVKEKGRLGIRLFYDLSPTGSKIGTRSQWGSSLMIRSLSYSYHTFNVIYMQHMIPDIYNSLESHNNFQWCLLPAILRTY